jgi:hypothetical protein
MGKMGELSRSNFMKKLSIKKVVKVERKMSTGCPSSNTSQCGVNYRGN